MKTKTPFILTMLLAAVLAHAAPQSLLTVAVYDFTGDINTASLGSKVTTLLTANLTTETNLVMLERAELMKALNEQAFGSSGMVSSDAAAKIGQITGAKILVTGQVIKIEGNDLVIVANIIGTETGRLFADKVEGAADNLSDLTSDLSHKIAQTITLQASNFTSVAEESHADRLERIVKGIVGTNRPSVSVSFGHYGKPWEEHDVENEWGAVLVKAGFQVVDANSDRKPDVEITGDGTINAYSRKGGLNSYSYEMDAKVQDRRTGNFIAFEHQKGSATEVGEPSAIATAQINAVDALAERILPLLAK